MATKETCVNIVFGRQARKPVPELYIVGLSSNAKTGSHGAIGYL